MALITPLKGDSEDTSKPSKTSRTIDDGPPSSASRPKPVQPKGSLFQQSSRDISTQNSLGLGPEGGSPQVIANQALAQILTGVKTLSTLLPGLVPVLSDLTGRLSMIVPQMMNDFTNGGTGLVPPMGMPLPQPGMAGPAAPPMGAMPPPPMGGMPPGMPPGMPGAGPMGPGMAGPVGPPVGGLPPPPMMPM